MKLPINIAVILILGIFLPCFCHSQRNRPIETKPGNVATKIILQSQKIKKEFSGGEYCNTIAPVGKIAHYLLYYNELGLAHRYITLHRLLIDHCGDARYSDSIQNASLWAEYFTKTRRTAQADSAFRRITAIWPAIAHSDPNLIKLQGDICVLTGKEDSAIICFEDAANIFGTHQPELKASIYISIGDIYKNSRRTEDALKAYRNAMKIALNTQRPQILSRLGSIYYEKGFYSEAEQIFHTIATGINDPYYNNFELQQYAICMQGLCFQRMEDFTSAETCFRKAIQNQTSPSGRKTYLYPYLLQYLGSVYFNLSRYEQAILYYRGAMKETNPADLNLTALIRCGIALSLAKSGKEAEAEATFREILSFSNKSLEVERIAFLNYSRFLAENGQAEKAVFLMNSNPGKEVLASSAPEMRSKFYQFLAFAEQKSGNFSQAEVLYQKALKENQKTKIASPADTILYIPRSIEIYFDFASLFIQTRATVGDSTGELFEKAMTQYHKAFGLIDLLRENVLSEESMLVINKNYKNLTEQYCTILLDNMKPGSDRKSYENAWQGIQRYKSMAMQISRKESLLKSNITEGSRISAMLRYLQLEKDFYLSEKSGEESMPSPDSSKIAGFEYRITQINRSYHLIKKRLIDDDPARFSRYFEPDFQRLSQLQQSLGDGIGVIDLFVPDSGIFAAFYITADTFWVHHENSGELKSLTDSLAKYVEFADIDHHNELMQSKFEEFSYQLFKLLGLKQFIEKDITRIHVIPSPESAPIPFDILLTEPAEPDQNYSNYPYLIRKAEIVWSYSPVYINESYPAPLSDPNIAAFAPEYQCSTSGNITLGKLRKNTDEVDFACRFFSGNTYTGDAASIANFVRETKTADIIHLAVHSSGSTRSASECGIYFSGDNSGECPFFNRNRISNLNTKARLAVISSCNSGSGIHAEGEGALSLSRSFYISGCSSVIASFWAADDYATSGIIKKFYSHIASGRPVSSALRDAKLEFLEDAGSLRAHPFFWSNLFVLGSADLQITSDNNNDFGYTNLLFPLLSGIGIISFFFFAQRKKISDLR